MKGLFFLFPGADHILTWPQLLYLAEDSDGKIVGYVLGKMFVVCSPRAAVLAAAHGAYCTRAGKKKTLSSMATSRPLQCCAPTASLVSPPS